MYVKMRPKTYRMATTILLKFLTLGWDISRTIWLVMAHFCIFYALAFELNLFFDRSFPLKVIKVKPDRLVVKVNTIIL